MQMEQSFILENYEPLGKKDFLMIGCAFIITLGTWTCIHFPQIQRNKEIITA